MEQWIITFGIQHSYLVYVPIVLVAFAEGPILSIFFGLLLRLGYFSLLPVYAALMFGDLLGDVMWYYIGYHYGMRAIKKFGKRFGITEEGVERVERLFHKYTTKILFISKITNGFGLALVVLTTAGIVRIPFRKYISINLAGQFIWSGLLLATGYYFSDAFMRINSIFGKAALVIAALVVLAALVAYYRQLKKKILAK